jgi:hypothetical protein
MGFVKMTNSAVLEGLLTKIITFRGKAFVLGRQTPNRASCLRCHILEYGCRTVKCFPDQPFVKMNRAWAAEEKEHERV